jgi:hypothetical protein
MRQWPPTNRAIEDLLLADDDAAHLGDHFALHLAEAGDATSEDFGFQLRDGG